VSRKRALHNHFFSSLGTTKILLLPARQIADGINLLKKIKRKIALSCGNSAILRPFGELKAGYYLVIALMYALALRSPHLSI